ncbi:iron-sulfur flavoprotein [Candidatus Methanoplasma termitum]|uniref:Iron-sulfur flavoprotein n=1 Tax=Candidatus Methanoplasma termitum TaxID=1577791 RepID=A0A0A7LAM0_9ARCH|nr:flavodoxin family protein [Candidatus Methanoplasma termitum]AIZ56084.1 iron-sulfur flavoprotein [Candidatus Methanoplasma termitum]MCL2333786.1 flavodoxin family protein [Candidatus Methanoplasma sp.]
MKVIALNGSPRLIGNTSNILHDVADEFEKEGIETEHVQLYSYNLEKCNDCRSCEIRGDGRCILEDDELNDIVDAMREADGIILASPCYYGACSAQMKIFLERAGLILEKGDKGLKRKVGGAIVVNAHDGGSMVYYQLVNWMLRNQMIVCGGAPAPIVTALNSPQYQNDKDGMKGVIGLAKEMAWAISKLSQ